MKSWEQRLGSLLIALRLDSIRRKIVVLAVLATLIPAMSTALLSHAQNRRALTETLQAELSSVGSQSARELDIWFRERFYEVRIFASSFEVSENLDRLHSEAPGESEDALGRLNDYLSGVQGRFGEYYRELVVVDENGIAVASSGPRASARNLPDDWPARLRAGEAVVGQPYLGEDRASVLAALAQPIDVDGRYQGFLLATLDFGTVPEILAPFARGDESSVDLILADGRRVAGTGAESALEPAFAGATLAGLQAASGATLEYEDAGGVTMLGTLTTIGSVRWSVVAQVTTREAYAQIGELTKNTTILVTVLLIVVGSVAYLLGLFIVKPLVRLTEGAAAVADGDLSIDIPVTTGGEVGYLTGVFNRMVGQLRRSREELAAANLALRQQNEELEHLSMTDALTGLYNRRYVMNEFEKEVHRAERHERMLAVLMLDIDKFKQYNDAYGHPAGDEVLMGMGRVIEDATRDPDVPGRFGGEEFIVLMPDCDLSGAIDAAERIRKRLDEEVFEGGKVTCSIGAAQYPMHGTTASALIAAADVALYDAKAAGRNKVVAAVADGTAAGGKAPPSRKRTAKKK